MKKSIGFVTFHNEQIMMTRSARSLVMSITTVEHLVGCLHAVTVYRWRLDTQVYKEKNDDLASYYFASTMH